MVRRRSPVRSWETAPRKTPSGEFFVRAVSACQLLGVRQDRKAESCFGFAKRTSQGREHLVFCEQGETKELVTPDLAWVRRARGTREAGSASQDLLRFFQKIQKVYCSCKETAPRKTPSGEFLFVPFQGAG